jgi:hypothetical protein
MDRRRDLPKFRLSTYEKERVQRRNDTNLFNLMYCYSYHFFPYRLRPVYSYAENKV